MKFCRTSSPNEFLDFRVKSASTRIRRLRICRRGEAWNTDITWSQSRDNQKCYSFAASRIALHFLIRLRQPQHAFGDEAQNQLRAHRCDASDERFSQVALD